MSLPPDPERLSGLVAELSAKASYAFGERRLPQPITPQEAVAVAEALSEQVDEGVTLRAELARRQSLRIHCHAGCTACCNVVVIVRRPEIERVVAFLESPHGAEARERFVAAYGRWRAGLADVLPALERESVSQKAQALFFELLIAATQRRVLCAFNHEGRCAVYPVRPLGCRDAHALDTDAYCASDHPARQKADALEFVPLDRLMVDSARLLRAVHNNMQDTVRHQGEALCQGVARRIGIEPGEP